MKASVLETPDAGGYKWFTVWFVFFCGELSRWLMDADYCVYCRE